MNSPNLTGQTFGRLTVIEPAGKNARGSRLWRLLCECGGMVVTTTYELNRGSVRSCGCLKRDHHRRICGGLFRGGA